jgi:ubiquitin-conjugating enzyme E2 S
MVRATPHTPRSTLTPTLTLGQNSKSMRRLAADHGSLHTAGLPPNYLFPPSYDSSELTSLDMLLAGPKGTPYATGVWRLHLDIPPTYPTAPPTAHFRTRLWHPNIDEATGAVCVETLKRDWSSSLRLRDVLVTISCLLIQPNPASALNEAAGKLASEDWAGFCRRAKLMTDIHAAVPASLAQDVHDAQSRGEDTSLHPGPVHADTHAHTHTHTKPHALAKGKERTKATPASSKAQRRPAEDEENAGQRGETQELASDPESDWIPGPDKMPETAARQDTNIFGIKGLEAGMQLGAPTSRIYPANPQALQLEDDNGAHVEEEVVEEVGKETNHGDDSNPFVTVASRRTINTSHAFDMRLPLPTTSSINLQPTSTDTPELLKFSHQNPFSAIQPNNQTHPLLKEFSYSWEDSGILHDTRIMQNRVSKLEIRKRMAGEDFESRKDWEMKRFKKAGYDLPTYNRGGFGPRVGMGRL